MLAAFKCSRPATTACHSHLVAAASPHDRRRCWRDVRKRGSDDTCRTDKHDGKNDAPRQHRPRNVTATIHGYT